MTTIDYTGAVSPGTLVMELNVSGSTLGLCNIITLVWYGVITDDAVKNIIPLLKGIIFFQINSIEHRFTVLWLFNCGLDNIFAPNSLQASI